MKYQFNVNLVNSDLKHAGNKAVTDGEHILTKKGYKNISLVFNKSKKLIWLSLIKLTGQALTWTIRIKPGSLIVVQYPIIGINRFFNFFIDLLKKKRCFVACVLHDINTLRYQETDQEVKKEIDRLNAYDIIITHNYKMTQWLKGKGITTIMLPIRIFDYLYENENRYNRLEAFIKGATDVVYAGNLTRGKFIQDLYQVEKTRFKLYGPCVDPVTHLKVDPIQINKQKNVVWEGVYEPEELLTTIEGTFGLVWDGDSITNCEGEFGNYIQYNNPHKLSLYLAAGLPLIIPYEAALREFVETNNIGIAINSLKDIPAQIGKIEVDAYDKMLKNIASLKYKLKHGHFFSSVLDLVEKEYENSNQH